MIQYRGECQRPDSAASGDGAHLAEVIGRHALGPVGTIRSVALLAGRVVESTAGRLDGQQPLQPPSRLVQQVGHTVPGLGDAGVVLPRREIGGGRQQPKERRIGRSTIEREVAGIVPALYHSRGRKRGVAGVDPWALSVFCIDLGEGPLVVEGALHGAHGRIEHARPDVEGVAGGPVLGNDTIPPRSPQGSEVACPYGPDGPERIGANFSDGWSALKAHPTAGTHYLE